MSLDDLRVHLLNLQPFQLRRRFYKLNAKGANLPMLGNNRDQVNRLIETFRRISVQEQREVFPEYFRRRRINPLAGNMRNNRQTRLNPPENPPVIRPTISLNPPESLVNSGPQTPNLDVNPRPSPADFASPLRLAPTAQQANQYQITPRRQRRASITGSPAPASLQPQNHGPARRRHDGSLQPQNHGPTRRRSMSVSGGETGARVETTMAGEGGRQITRIECKVCLVGAVECALMPCGHASVCYGCARQLLFGFSASRGKCPICRGKIANVHRIYF